MTKASAYRDALKNFVQGYQEGLKEILNTGTKSNDGTDVNSSVDSKTLKDEKVP